MGFAEQLKIARNKIGYTQQEVADAMGITKSTYCGYETGKRQPDVSKIKLLAQILNTSGDVLLETGFEVDVIHGRPHINTIAAHFDGDEYTEEEIDEINKFAEFVKQRRKK